MEVVWDLMGSAEAKHYRGSSAKARLYLESGIRKTNASPAVPVSLPGPREQGKKKMDKDILKKIPWDHLLYLIRKSTFCAANKSGVSHEDLYHITH